MAKPEIRDARRVLLVIGLLIIVHAILFDVDDFDVTQFWIAGFGYAILRAIREGQSDA